MYFIAHRGNDNHKFKENTVGALTDSLNQNYINGVEFDIRLTKDKQIIIYHNMLINDNNNILSLIKNKTLDEIKKTNINIPTLEEFLKSVNTNKILIIEIKEESSDDDTFIIKLFNILKKYKNFKIYICSFNYKVMKKIKSKYKQYKCGLIIGYLMNVKHINGEFDFYLYGTNYLEYIDYNKEIFIFDINSKEKLSNIKKQIKKDFNVISDKSYLLNLDSV